MTDTEIIPAILPQDFAELEEKAELVKGLVKTVQVDICDGHFVPSFTWPYKKSDNNFELIIRENEGLPFWDEVDYEFDLMVNNPEKIVDEWVATGATRIIIHAESKGNIAEAISKLSGRVEIGLALNIETPVSVIEPFRDLIQFVQIMGIDHIGFQGQGFDKKAVGKVKEVHLKYPVLPISVDGGVSPDNAEELIAAGATRLVIGSVIWHSDNIAETIHGII